MRRLGVKTVLGLLAVGVAAGLAATAGPANAAYPGKPGLIAFVSKGDIFTIQPNGAGLKRLTGDGHASGPRWSPNGTKIAYLDGGNLWVMNANGSNKTRLTNQAPAFTDSRPAWSPNGKYLAFVRTARHAAFGYLTRYNTANGIQVRFTTTVNGHLIDVTALPAPVAWTLALNASNKPGYFIAFEGAASLCPAASFKYCLDLLGLGSQSQFANGFPSSEFSHKTAVRFTNPDWYPIRTRFATDVIVTSESCPGGHCAVTGSVFPITTPILPGSYQAVFAPNGAHIAFVKNVNGIPWIFTQITTLDIKAVALVKGTEPDWQPLPPL